jgi:hypothetical protein
MPVATLHVLEGQYDDARLAKVSGAVHQGLIRALDIPPERLLPDHSRVASEPVPSYALVLGLNYSDDLILLEITFISGRPKATRLSLLRALNDGVVAAAGIEPDDLMITLYETPGENISFGCGLAQRAHISGTDPKAAYADDRS